MLTPQELATVHKFIRLVTGDRSCLSDRQRRWLDVHKDTVAALHVTGACPVNAIGRSPRGAVAHKYRPSWWSEEDEL